MFEATVAVVAPLAKVPTRELVQPLLPQEPFAVVALQAKSPPMTPVPPNVNVGVGPTVVLVNVSTLAPPHVDVKPIDGYEAWQ
jgi:hypothetical protein